jgi:hypothetical protein
MTKNAASLCESRVRGVRSITITCAWPEFWRKTQLLAQSLPLLIHKSLTTKSKWATMLLVNRDGRPLIPCLRPAEQLPCLPRLSFNQYIISPSP